jgi:hypothetical protein
MNTLFRIVAIITLAAVLTACGVRSAYNNLDWLIMRWVNDQVSLSSDQDRTLRQTLDQQLRWHCASELPEYATFLGRVKADVTNEQINVERMSAHAQSLATFALRLVEETRPAMIELLASLDDDQIDDLLAGFAERNEEIVEKSIDVSDQQRRQDQVRGMERGMRRFVGRLTGEQRQRLEQWAEELQPTAEVNFQQRRQWQERFATALEQRHDLDVLANGLEPLLTPGADWTDAYRERMEYNRERTIEALVDVHRMAPERQVNRLRSRLDSLASDFDRLSCAPPPGMAMQTTERP